MIIAAKLLAKSQFFVIMILFATVAQLVEQLIRNQQVAGSSPASSSKKSRKAKAFRDFLKRPPCFARANASRVAGDAIVNELNYNK